MSVNLEWSYASSVITEPFANTASTSYEMTLSNSGSNSATGIGFYLKQASTEGDISNPSTDGILADWNDALVKGSVVAVPEPGFQISQDGGLTWERFSFTIGYDSENPIPLTIGSGVDGSNIGPGESVDLTFKYVPEVGDPARRLYIQIELVYTEV